MTRKRWIQVNGELIPSEDYFPAPAALHQIMGDIQPYQSQMDGSMIMGRRQHREHLREHSLIEIGNETGHLKNYGDYRSKGIKDDLIREVHRYKERNRHG